MAKRFPLLLIALLIMGFTVAGCGDDDKASDSSNTTAETQTQTDASGVVDTPTTTGDDSDKSSDDSKSDDSGSDAPDVSNQPQVKNAVKQCKQSVNSAPQLKDSTKQKLADICEKAASGDRSGIKEASKEVCLAIIEDTGISGPAADTAKQQCETISK